MMTTAEPTGRYGLRHRRWPGTIGRRSRTGAAKLCRRHGTTERPGMGGAWRAGKAATGECLRCCAAAPASRCSCASSPSPCTRAGLSAETFRDTTPAPSVVPSRCRHRPRMAQERVRRLGVMYRLEVAGFWVQVQGNRDDVRRAVHAGSRSTPTEASRVVRGVPEPYYADELVIVPRRPPGRVHGLACSDDARQRVRVNNLIAVQRGAGRGRGDSEGCHDEGIMLTCRLLMTSGLAPALVVT